MRVGDYTIVLLLKLLMGSSYFPPDLYNQISGEKEEERKAVQKRFTFNARSFSETCPTLSEFHNLGGMAHAQLSMLNIAFFR